MTREQEIRNSILELPAIRFNLARHKRADIGLRGANLVTPYFACMVEDEDGEVCEISFDVHMEPLSSDPIYGVTYRRLPDGSTNPKDGAVHSLDELVVKLYPGLADMVETMHRHPANG
jgi:hypothetical protein